MPSAAAARDLKTPDSIGIVAPRRWMDPGQPLGLKAINLPMDLGGLSRPPIAVEDLLRSHQNSNDGQRPLDQGGMLVGARVLAKQYWI